MVEMFLYGVAIMYSPGPINLIGLNLGIQGKLKQSITYFIGVGFAMFILFNLYGFTGQSIIKTEHILYVSLIGSMYIAYLAYKVFKSTSTVEKDTNDSSFKFKQGLTMHILNPKASLATLPIATIYFPTLEITGFQIVYISLILSIIAGGAPTLYSIVGNYFKWLIDTDKKIQIVNRVMAVILLYIAVMIFIDHVYLVLTGVNPY